MRPRTLIRGNLCCGAHDTVKSPRFNEAADSHPRKHHHTPRGGLARGGFNEAADSHPRKRGDSERAGREGATLQ